MSNRPRPRAPGRLDATRPEDDATLRLTSITGVEAALTPDPTEDYHEASRLWPGIVDPLVHGAARLEANASMRVTSTRSVKRYGHLPFVALPHGDLGTVPLATVLARRRSRRTYAAGMITREQLASLLQAAYGVTGGLAGTPQKLRSAPSGGALYPVELYVISARVAHLDRAVFHYDPLRHGLERLRPLGRDDESGDLTPYPELLSECCAFVVLTAMFWRSRFKYGSRAYRFTLLEAGHLAQNFLLAAEALGLAATPIGGFYDARVDDFLGLDGLYEASLYLLPVGRQAGR